MKIIKILLIVLIIVFAFSAYVIYKDSRNPKTLNSTNEQSIQNTDKYIGIIKRFTRPEPDIAYDYKIILSKPVIDKENASGLNQTVSFYILVPSSDEIKQQLEVNLDKNVELTGQMKWGYAESKYFYVTNVVPK